MATKIRPLGDRVLVKRVEAETKTASGLFLPETAKEKPQKAKVLALGQGRALKDGSRAPFLVKVGDTVLLTKWGGTELKVDGEEVVAIGEEDILGIIDE